MVLAKSEPLENPKTLWEHTADVIENAKTLHELYPSLDFLGDNEKYFWDALYLACKTHDMGKLASPFQYHIHNNLNKQREKFNITTLPVEKLKEQANKVQSIPHNILSPLFVLGDTKSFPKNIKKYICQAVAYHHNRGLDYINNTKWHEVKKAIDNDLKHVIRDLSDKQPYVSNDMDTNKTGYMHYLKNPEYSADDKFYVMLKGFLHRADYCASAGVDINVTAPNYNRNTIIDKLKKSYPNNWQTKSLQNHFNDNIIMQAGTGMGKTEFALSWSADTKTFYTLPMKASTNAIFERVMEIFNLDKTNVGLLHSDAAEYVQSKDENDSMQTPMDTIQTMRQLSMPISISTADQLFSSVFCYPGYERIYSTMAHSKIIVDEIQAYDPGIIAAILYGLVDFTGYGAKFCIITATLPEFCVSYLDKHLGKIAKPKPKYKDTPRHKITLIDGSIDDDCVIDIIKSYNKYQSKKILIILNTVNATIQLKQKLDSCEVSTNLLHSRFTYEDRAKKEHDKESGILKAESGIWVTTQIVEASVDIDFDVLITEISTMDSQIQRWGRIWRNRDGKAYCDSNPNIYILKQPSDEGYVYSSDIVSKTRGILESNQGKMLSDADEYDMFNCVFSTKSLEDTKHLDKFDCSLEMLSRYKDLAESKKIAQKLFRDVPNISAIPKSVYEENKDEIDNCISDLSNREKRRGALSKIKNKTVSVRTKYVCSKIKLINERYKIRIVDLKYSFDYGLQISNKKNE